MHNQKLNCTFVLTKTEKMTKAKFKIGDNVKLKNFGKTYTTYEDMFELMGFKNTQYNGDIKNKEVGTIFGVQLHENQDTILYAIRTLDGREALIGEEGLIKVAPPKEEPKQETLEEAARNYAIKKRERKHLSNREFDLCQKDFIVGAKWQQEKMYSEEEVHKLTLEAIDLGMRIRQDQLSGYSEKSGKELHKEWFDKVKKK